MIGADIKNEKSANKLIKAVFREEMPSTMISNVIDKLRRKISENIGKNKWKQAVLENAINGKDGRSSLEDMVLKEMGDSKEFKGEKEIFDFVLETIKRNDDLQKPFKKMVEEYEKNELKERRRQRKKFEYGNNTEEDLRDLIENGKPLVMEDEKGNKCLISKLKSNGKYGIYSYVKGKDFYPPMRNSLSLDGVVNFIKKHKLIKSEVSQKEIRRLKRRRGEYMKIKRNNKNDGLVKSREDSDKNSKIITKEQFEKEFYPIGTILRDGKKNLMLQISDFKIEEGEPKVYVCMNKANEDLKRKQDYQWLSMKEFEKIYDNDKHIWEIFENKEEYEAKNRNKVSVKSQEKEIRLSKEEQKYFDKIITPFVEGYAKEMEDWMEKMYIWAQEEGIEKSTVIQMKVDILKNKFWPKFITSLKKHKEIKGPKKIKFVMERLKDKFEILKS